jgi:hypothetical protein
VGLVSEHIIRYEVLHASSWTYATHHSDWLLNEGVTWMLNTGAAKGVAVLVWQDIALTMNDLLM